MNIRLTRNAFSVTAISIITFGMAIWLAGCSDNVVDPETIPPSQPTNVVGTRLDSTVIDLTWTASTDNVCVAGYNVYRDDSEELVLAGVTPINSFRDTALVSDVTYSYSVEAFDCSNNISPRSPLSDPITPPEPTPGDSTILNSAVGFAGLAGTTITSTGATVVSGNLGLSPGSSVTGFPPGQVMPLDDIHINDELAIQAKVDLTAAYLFLSGHAPGASAQETLAGKHSHRARIHQAQRLRYRQET